MIAGVCGGLGDYLAVDATALRLAFVALTVLTGFVPGILIYVVAIFLVPAEEGPGPRVRDADAGHATWRESGRW
jgi:phage shock protein C